MGKRTNDSRKETCRSIFLRIVAGLAVLLLLMIALPGAARIGESSNASSPDPFGRILSGLVPGSVARAAESGTSYQTVISDQADLLTDSEEASLQEAMQKAAIQGNMVFYTTNDSLYDGTTQCEAVSDQYFSSGDSVTVFGIFMGNRQLYLYNTGTMRSVIRDARATSVMDNVYRLAGNGDYKSCAIQTFRQIQKAEETGHIAEPMRIIVLILISLAGGVTIAFVAAVISRSRLNGSMSGEKSPLRSSNLSFTEGGSRITRDYIYVEPEPNSTSSGGSHGSGGGFSGGGGGGSHGGGGGHGF